MDSNFQLGPAPLEQGNLSPPSTHLKVKKSRVSELVEKIESAKSFPMQAQPSSMRGASVKRGLISTPTAQDIIGKFEKLAEVAKHVKKNSLESIPAISREALRKSAERLKKSMDTLSSSMHDIFTRPAKVLQEAAIEKQQDPRLEQKVQPAEQNLSEEIGKEQIKEIPKEPQAKEVETSEKIEKQQTSITTSKPEGKKSPKVLPDIDQWLASQGAELKKLSYAEQLKEYQSKQGGFNRTQAYRFMLNPDQKQFRKDFLLAGPWMEFVRHSQGSKRPTLVQQMVKIYSNPGTSIEQKKVILEFAKEVIERRILSKKSMQSLSKIAKQEIHKPREERNAELVKLAQEFRSAKPEPLEKAKDIQYTTQYATGSLAKQFKKIATGKTKITSKQDKHFIKDFAQDLTTLSANSFKAIHQSEFYQQAWNKNVSVAPNIQYSTQSFNQISDFLVQQILQTNNPKERARIYRNLVKVGYQLLEKHHDYFSAMAVMSALAKPAITRLIPPKLAESVTPLEEFFSGQKNFKTLRDAVQACEKQGIPYVPYLGIFLTGFVFVDDGNPQRDAKKVINFDRMELASKIHQGIEQGQNQLEKQTHLHYDLMHEIIQGASSLDDESLWEQSYKLQPSKSKP